MKLNFFKKVWAMFHCLGMVGEEAKYVVSDTVIWDSKRLILIEERLDKLEAKKSKKSKLDR